MPWLESPPRQRALDFLREQVPSLVDQRRTLVLVGRCRMEYEGYARSSAPWGDRLLILKADGSVMVHDPVGFKPTNWMPAGCALTVGSGEYVWIEVTRTPPPGFLRIEIDRVDLVGAAQMERGSAPRVQGRESDLRDALRDHPELVEPGFVPWATERLTDVGPMDLYGEDAQGRRVVVECKVVAAGLAEATQLWRYVEDETRKRQVAVRGILVAPSVSARARLLLAEHGLEYREVPFDGRGGWEGVPRRPVQPSLAQFVGP